MRNDTALEALRAEPLRVRMAYGDWIFAVLTAILLAHQGVAAVRDWTWYRAIAGDIALIAAPAAWVSIALIGWPHRWRRPLRWLQIGGVGAGAATALLIEILTWSDGLPPSALVVAWHALPAFAFGLVFGAAASSVPAGLLVLVRSRRWYD